MCLPDAELTSGDLHITSFSFDEKSLTRRAAYHFSQFFSRSSHTVSQNWMKAWLLECKLKLKNVITLRTKVTIICSFADSRVRFAGDVW